MKWFQFILSHSIFISICAAALCYQSFLLLHLPVNHFVSGLIFFATLCSYNFYWLVSKYHFNQQKPVAVFLKENFSNVFCFSVAAGGLLLCLLYLPGIIPPVFVAVLLTLLYSVPLWPVKALAFTKKAGFIKTMLLAFTWSYVTVLIPVIQADVVIDIAVILLFSARFFFMLMLCIIFDSRDIVVDKIHSLRSLATDVSRPALRMIMAVVFSLYIICGFFLRFYFNNHIQLLAFLITGLITLYIYRLSLKPQGYIFYYFLVDGLMLFSVIASYVATI